jgi:hypothetical protein
MQAMNWDHCDWPLLHHCWEARDELTQLVERIVVPPAAPKNSAIGEVPIIMILGVSRLVDVFGIQPSIGRLADASSPRAVIMAYSGGCWCPHTSRSPALVEDDA